MRMFVIVIDKGTAKIAELTDKGYARANMGNFGVDEGMWRSWQPKSISAVCEQLKTIARNQKEFTR